MARQSKFNIGFIKINQMSVKELEAYVKKAKPYTVRKVKGLAASDYAYFSDVLSYVRGEAHRASLYGAEGKIGQALINHIDDKHDPVKATQILIEGSKTPEELRRTARFINYISSINEQPAKMAKEYIATAQDIKTILTEWGYDDASKMLGEILENPKGLATIRDFWREFQDELFADYASGDGEDGVNITYYRDTYGENTEQFYLELFKHINELMSR